MNLAPVNVFETGSNQWKTFRKWPPEAAKEKSLYFLPNGKLSFDPPKTNASFSSYISDPNKPIPFLNNASMDMEREYMTADQRFAATRPDVLTYQTDVLADDVTLAGNIWANLKVAISGTDADFVVKVIDVYPDSTRNTSFTGINVVLSHYEQMVRSEAMRGKYRNSFSRPEPFVPGKITPVNFELQDILHTFKKGHRIMVQVQSTWFPLIDRNPQQFMNIMKAKPEDFKKATIKVYEGKDAASFLKVRVM